jgi:hypothetical protein
MIDLRYLSQVRFGEEIELEHRIKTSIAKGIQKYFGKENTGLIPKQQLEHIFKQYEDLETKYGEEHFVVINEDKELIETLNKSLYTNPIHLFGIKTPLRLEKETGIYGRINTTKLGNNLEPVEFGNSYIMNPKGKNFNFGLTIATTEEIQTYTQFNKTLPK